LSDEHANKRVTGFINLLHVSTIVRIDRLDIFSLYFVRTRGASGVV
jgi:hypothetical protein